MVVSAFVAAVTAVAAAAAVVVVVVVELAVAVAPDEGFVAEVPAKVN